MTSQDEDKSRGLSDAVERRGRRREEWQRSGERPVWRNLAMIGALGWLVVTPMLVGILVGRWLDTRYGTGIFWSGALIMLGASLGGYLAWQRMGKD
ncbi:MAG: AtpZ/AtpI family protein [Hyphomicrobiaceae bacterium]